jgi:putative ABC transport system substrate-binding protein
VSRPSRRQFVQSVGAMSLALVAGCGRLPGQVQEPPRVPRIGILQGEARAYASFLEGLQELGYVEGQNMLIERRYGGPWSDSLLEESIGELVRLPVDVLVVASTAYARTAHEVSSTIPIVVAGQGQPLASGLAASLGRPGGNVTGLNSPRTLAGKRLELVKQAIPAVTRVALLWGAPSLGNFAEPHAAARALGIDLDVVHARRADELEGAFAAITQQRADALLGSSQQGTLSSRQRIVDLALQHRLPSMGDERNWAAAGGLMSYGTDRAATWRRAAYYVARILQGALPAELPIEQPTKFDFVINLKTAEALGLTIPPQVLAQATEVLQ